MRTQNSRYYATDKDYYVAHGKAAYFRGYTKYSDIEAYFANMTPATIQAAAHEFPYMKDMHWCSQFRWVKSCYDQNGKMPTTSSRVEQERASARFIINMRNSRVITDEQKSLLDSITPDWRLTKGDIWEASIKKAVAFYRNHGRLPVHSRTNKEEKVLRSWIEGNKKVGLSPERKERLDQLLPGWDETDNDRWYAKLKKVSDFYAVQNKAPLKNAKSKEERSLGEWLSGARWDFKHTDKLDSDQIAALEAGVPGWSAGFGEHWEAALKEVVALIAANNRMPEDSDMGTHGSLGGWLRTQRENLGVGLAQERIDALNQHVPGWDETLDQRWERKLISLAAYLDQHDKFPSDSDKTDPAAKDLGSWYQVQKRDRKKGDLREDRKTSIDTAIPHWYDSWEFKLHKTAAYARTHNRFPSSKNPDKSVAAMGLWMGRQRRDSLKLTPFQLTEINRVLPGWNAVK